LKRQCTADLGLPILSLLVFTSGKQCFQQEKNYLSTYIHVGKKSDK